MMRNRCCCNCRHDIRVWEDGNCTNHCEIDGHYIGYIQCFDGWCRHWAKDKWQTNIPNPQNLPWINHKDEDKSNNFVGNLEWCTPLYNNTYNGKNIKHSEKLKGRSFTDEHKERIRQGNLGKHGQQRKVICVDDGMVFGSYNEAGKHYGISPMTVKSCCERKSKGKVKTFRYADGKREGE